MRQTRSGRVIFQSRTRMTRRTGAALSHRRSCSTGSDTRLGRYAVMAAASEESTSVTLAAQPINGDGQVILQGSVSNGEVWQFGKLQGRDFVRDPRPFTILDLATLFAALHAVFESAKQQAQQN